LVLFVLSVKITEAAKTLSFVITDYSPLLPRAVISVSSIFVFGMLFLYCLLWDLSCSGIFTVVDTLLYYSRPKVIYTAINYKNDFLINKTNFLS
jgi:hypothetical protein